jgi:phosphohistidine phosphatase
MDLWLVRHGEAVPEREDPARPLSSEGARAIRAIVESLAGKTGVFDLVAASGKKRAIQTAAIWAEAAGYPAGKIAETAALNPNATPETFLGFLENCGEEGRILCVGHLPSIAAIASFFLSDGAPVRLAFAPGSVCRIRVGATRRGAGELLLFV